MTNEQRLKLIAISWDLHSVVETAYLGVNAKPGDDEWLEKQCILLADKALHLL